MTSPIEYVVTLVFDPHTGPKLHEIAQRTDLWVVPSPENREASEAVWAKQDGARRHELTLWSNPIDLTSDGAWLSLLQVIELHHGEYSHDPPVTTLDIIGAEPNDTARQALSEYDYGIIELTESGFRARKMLAS